MNLFIELLLTCSMWPRPGANARVAGLFNGCRSGMVIGGGPDHVTEGLGRGPVTGATRSGAQSRYRQVRVPS
ncbi:MAG: hypothetical protein JWL95_869 [Gemmatimonadetes bacterium]|nr:hypothetical protein [Gemmatimonadota bacterium]